MKIIHKYDLFNPAPENLDSKAIYSNAISNDHLKQINGLAYIPEFIDEHLENLLIEKINNSLWLVDIKRRVQHYGWRYDYKSRDIDYSMYLGKLPDWAEDIAKKLVQLNLVAEEPDQVIINEYQPGQGIANHVDCVPCFGDTIISLSLGSTCTMDFINTTTKLKLEAVLAPRSLVVIKGDSRYSWTHGIPARLTDSINGNKVNREVRLSLTFRKVILK